MHSKSTLCHYFFLLKQLKLNNKLYLLNILIPNLFFCKNLLFFVDASNFLDIKYTSFTGLGWFDNQLKEGE
jgi:hypothetical protein